MARDMVLQRYDPIIINAKFIGTFIDLKREMRILDTSRSYVLFVLGNFEFGQMRKNC
jgi:hypothetical protein